MPVAAAEQLRNPRAASFWRRVLLWVAVATLVGGAVGMTAREWGLHPVRVTSNSMAPTISRGDFLAVGGVGALHRRDVVLFRYPLGTTGRAVKRAIAVGGDTVVFTDRYVSVNGRRTAISPAPVDAVPAGERRVVHVPAGRVFLLGDNSAVSIDSRSFGPVPESEIVGRVRFVIPVPSSWTLAAVAAVVLAACVVAARGFARLGTT